MATAGAAKEDRQLVADEFAAVTPEDGRPFGQTRPILLAGAGGESFAAAAVWGVLGQDRGATPNTRVCMFVAEVDFGGERGSGRKKGLSAGSEKRQLRDLDFLWRSKTDPFSGPWKHPALKTRPDIPFRGVYYRLAGKSVE